MELFLVGCATAASNRALPWTCSHTLNLQPPLFSGSMKIRRVIGIVVAWTKPSRCLDCSLARLSHARSATRTVRPFVRFECVFVFSLCSTTKSCVKITTACQILILSGWGWSYILPIGTSLPIFLLNNFTYHNPILLTTILCEAIYSYHYILAVLVPESRTRLPHPKREQAGGYHSRSISIMLGATTNAPSYVALGNWIKFTSDCRPSLWLSYL